MIITGAGGHSLEIFDVLLTLGFNAEEILFYDDYTSVTVINNCKVLKNKTELRDNFKLSTEFCLGVGNPNLRNQMYNLMTELGGTHYSVISPFAAVSKFCTNEGADIMPFSFISSKTILGKGVLINTRANIHHEVEIGDFTEVSPSSNILGKVKIGAFCRIGANTTILPCKQIGDQVITGAGSVLTKDVFSFKKIVGIPGKSV